MKYYMKYHMKYHTPNTVVPIARRWLSTTTSVLLAALVVVAAPARGIAQVSPEVTTAVNQARAHINSGDGVLARTVLDSLVKNAPRASDDLAEALYWRAVMSEQVADAEQDWKRLIVEAPLSPRTPDALLRLGELEILRGRPASARVYYERILRDFPDSPQRSKAMLWTARSYFEERDIPHACETVAALRAGAALEGEQRLQSNEMQGRCDNAAARALEVAADSVAEANRTSASNNSRGSTAKPASSTASSTSGRFSVQLAATDTKAQATAMVKRLAARGVKARVDGTRKPFRIRVGHYETRAAAAEALARLKKQGHTGFVAELDK